MLNMRKNLMIISLLLIFCISLGAVSAADIDVNDITQENLDDSPIAVDGLDNGNGGDSAIAGLKEGKKTFKDLNDKISDSEREITLDEDYEFNSDTDSDFIYGIVINKDYFTIHGNGHTISGSNLARVFNITSSFVKIEEINFINGAIDRNVSGAVYWNGYGGILTNCNFTNCTSMAGGAVCWRGDLGSLYYCNFADCTSLIGGGAVFWEYDHGDIKYCTFTNCSSGNGGAIGWTGDEGDITHSIFINCSAFAVGGAIDSAGSNLTINYNIFDNNYADNGSAIAFTFDDINCDFNFFAFKNDVTEFPKLIRNTERSFFTPNNWVILNITHDDYSYYINFVLNDGSDVNGMPSYEVNLTINNESKNIVISDSEFSADVIEGNYVIKSLNSGDVLAETNISRVPVEDYSVVTWDCEYGDTAKVAVLVPKEITGNITVSVNDKIITEEIKEGVAVILINGLESGKHTLNISYSGNVHYAPFNTTAKLSVNKLNTTLIADDLNVSVSTSNDLIVTLKDGNGNVLADKNLTIKFNGENYTVTTNASGQAKLAIPCDVVGNYTVNIKFAGDNNYKGSSKSVNVTVYKVETVISASNLVVSAYASKDLVITLKDANGNLLTGKKVTFTINGNTYAVTTNASGQAKLAIRSIYVKNYPTTIKFEGDNTYLASSKSVNVTVVASYVTVYDIIKAAKTLKTSSEKNKELPTSIQVGSYKLTPGQLTYLMTVAIKNIYAGKSVSTQVKVINVKYTEYNGKVSKTVTKANYLKVVNYLYSKGVNGTLPKYFTYDKVIGYNVYTYSLAKILAFYASERTLPSYCVFTNY